MAPPVGSGNKNAVSPPVPNAKCLLRRPTGEGQSKVWNYRVEAAGLQMRAHRPILVMWHFRTDWTSLGWVRSGAGDTDAETDSLSAVLERRAPYL